MALKTTRYDTAKYLKTKKDVAAYLDAVFADGDPALIAHALGVVARTEGMAEIAKQAGPQPLQGAVGKRPPGILHGAESGPRPRPQAEGRRLIHP